MNADDFLRQHETCYCYNESFNFYYKHTMPRHEAEAFVARRNECKGGRWAVRRLLDYRDHFELLSDRHFAGDGSELGGA